MQFSITTVAILLPVLASAVAVPRAAAAANSGDLQTFTGALGGIAPIPVTNSGDAKRPFAVDGTTDVNIGAALQRSCAVQHNSCAQAANANKNAGFSVGDCDQQQQQCNAASQGASSSASGQAASDNAAGQTASNSAAGQGASNNTSGSGCTA